MNDVAPFPTYKSGTQTARANRRKAFVQAYLANGNNGRQAAITAGFSESGASAAAAMLLKEPSVIAQIQVDGVMAARAAGLTVERTMQEIARLAYSDPRKLFDKQGKLIPIHELDDDTAAAIASVEVEENYSGRGEERELAGFTKKIKAWDKNTALGHAVKVLGMATEKVEHTGTVVIQAHRLDADI